MKSRRTEDDPDPFRSESNPLRKEVRYEVIFGVRYAAAHAVCPLFFGGGCRSFMFFVEVLSFRMEEGDHTPNDR